MRRLFIFALGASMSYGCAVEAPDGEPSADDTSEPDTLAIVGGTTRADEAAFIGRLRLSDGSGCSATAIGRRTILTAAHCFNYQDRGATSPSGHIFERKTYRLGILRYESLGKEVGRDDVAVAELDGDLPEWLNPREIATKEPSKGVHATVFGFGCDSSAWNSKDHVFECRSSFGIMRYINFDWAGMSLSANDASAMGPMVAHGDSGGPVMYDARVIAVTSGTSNYFNKKDGSLVRSTIEFANPIRNRAAILRLRDTYESR